MKIKIDPLDTAFSKLMRKKYPVCQLCHSAKSSQVHHFKGRRHQNVRFDEENIWCVCFMCHRRFHEDPELACSMQRKRLGDNYDAFILRANQRKSRRDVDRELLKMYFKQEMGKFS